jgi:hypothetical protein
VQMRWGKRGHVLTTAMLVASLAMLGGRQRRRQKQGSCHRSAPDLQLNPPLMRL